MEIQPRHINLAELFSNRLFRIPPYQRSFSWESKQLDDLFEDIRKSFSPDSPSEHFMATVVALRKDKVPIGTNEYQRVDIVDGQQRITTLVLLLKAVEKTLSGSGNERDLEIASEIRKVLTKQDDSSHLLLQTNHDGSDYFATYINTGYSPDPQNAKTLADYRLLMAIGDCERFAQSWTEKEGESSLIGLVRHINSRLTFIFHEVVDEGLVYTVFEVLNSRGLEVSWFDRLKSMLMAIVFESMNPNREELIRQVHELWAGIYRVVGLRLDRSTESLRFAATLRNDKPVNRPLNEESAVNSILEQVDGKPSRVIEATMWLKEVTEAADKLQGDHRLNAVTGIQHARLVAVAINLRHDLSIRRRERALRGWENVTFRIFGLYRKDSRTAVGDYTRLARRIVNDKITADEILNEMGKIGRGYPAREAVDELREADCYSEWKEELRYFFQRYEEHLSRKAGQNFDNNHWNHIWKVGADRSIEHITPQSSGKNFVHQIGNLILLPPDLNSKLGKKSPKSKGKAYEATGLLIAQEATKRLRRPGKWTKKKIDDRERQLLRWAAREWAD